MLASAVVTIVVNGTLVPSSAPARIAAGRVVVPLAPIVTGIATLASFEPSSRRVTIVRANRRIVVPVAFIESDRPFLALAPIVRALGGYAQFDRASKTLAIVLPESADITTPVPFDPRAPQVAPTTIFTPEPPKPTPRVIFTGTPIPRRTAIPVIPSQPVIVR